MRSKFISIVGKDGTHMAIPTSSIKKVTYYPVIGIGVKGEFYLQIFTGVNDSIDLYYKGEPIVMEDYYAIVDAINSDEEETPRIYLRNCIRETGKRI